MNSNKQKWLWLHILILAYASMCFGQSTWTPRNSGTSEDLMSVTYGDSKFVAVGYNGKILTSYDGATWTIRASDTTEYLHSVTYGNGQFVAVGEPLMDNVSSKILTSSNGVTWITRNLSDTIKDLLSVTYGKGKFVAVGLSGVILISSDAITWTKVNSDTTHQLSSVTYGSDRFVIVGDSTILTSPNGTTWARNSDSAEWLNCVIYGNSLFLAIGTKALTSPDGTTWTISDSNIYYLPRSITYGNGQFVAVGSVVPYHSTQTYGIIRTSPDGNLWTPNVLTNPLITVELTGVTSDSGLFVAVGTKGTILTSNADITSTQTITKRRSEAFKISSNINKIIISLPIFSSDGTKITVEVFNIIGKRLYSAAHQTNNGILSIPVLSPGAYLMSITGTNTTYSSSFVISK